MWRIIKRKRNSKILVGLTLLLIVIAIPITVLFSQQEQDIRQRAASTQAVCGLTSVDAMLVIDKSGSMIDPSSDTDSTPKITRAKQAASKFVDAMANQTVDPNHFVGLTSISSNGSEKVESPLTDDYPAVKTAINGMNVAGGTCIECAAKLLNEEFAKENRKTSKNVAILLTDGGATRFIGYDPTSGMSDAERDRQSEQRALAEIMKGYRDSKITYYTIGLGDSVRADFLKKVANDTGGKYFYSPSTDQLTGIYQEISALLGKGAINGYVFKDDNQNKVFDSGEQKLPGWKVNLTDEASGSIAATLTTNSSGEYSFTGLCDGTYKVHETVQGGWTQTVPEEKEYTVPITDGAVVKDKIFGNFQPYACTQKIPTDTMIVFDISGSMKERTSVTDATPRMQRAKEAATAFVTSFSAQEVTPKHHLGLSTISTDMKLSTLKQQLNDKYTDLKTAINALTPTGGTCIECGLKLANDEINARKRTGTKKIAIILSDGGATRYIGFVAPADGNTHRIARERAFAEAVRGNDQLNISYFTIGFGDNVDEQLLTDIATSTGGEYFFAPDAATLKEVFQKIALKVGSGSISGIKYNDINSNGKFDESEEKMPTWDIKLQNTALKLNLSATTDTDGSYSFKDLCDGTYTITEVQKQGWVKTEPTTAARTIEMKNGEVLTDQNFGNKVAPTATPTFTPTPIPNATILQLTLLLHGIGNAGDNANLNEHDLSNKNPKRTQRPVTVQLYNGTEKVAEKSGSVIYDKAGGLFKGTIDFGKSFTSGDYSIKIKSDKYLVRRFSAPQRITAEKTNQIPSIDLIAGDTNNDNALNILDYNTIIGCYSDRIPAPSCSNDSKQKADINDDGIVNQYDYNLFIRELSVQQGD